jgi:hypothetical protein
MRCTICLRKDAGTRSPKRKGSERRAVTPVVARLLANASLAYVPELFMRPSTYFFS